MTERFVVVRKSLVYVRLIVQDFKGQNLAYSLTNYILYIGSLDFPSASTHPEGSLLAFLVGFVKQDMGTTVVLFLFTCLVAALVW